MSGDGPSPCSLDHLHEQGIAEPFVTSQVVDLQNFVFCQTLPESVM